MSYEDAATGERHAIGLKLPKVREDWEAKRRAVDTVMDDLGGVVIRVGDETVGEMWSLYDGRTSSTRSTRSSRPTSSTTSSACSQADPFHVSANTDPKGDRSKRPQDQDPDMLLHLVRETDNGIVVRGAKYETAAAYANQAFVKPTIANWGDSELSDYALGFICDMGSPGHQAHLPHRLRRPRTGRGLPARKPLRRGRHPGRLRRRRDPLGERAVLPAHPRGRLHPRHAAPLQRLRVRAARSSASPTC